MKKTHPSLLLAISLALSSIGGSQALAANSVSSGAWQHSFSLYAWLPTIDGELKYQREDGNSLPIDAGQILDALNMTFMGAYEGRKDNWFVLGDVIYLDLGQDKDRETIGYSNVELNLKGWQLGLYGGYALHHNERSNLDLLAGLRYLSIETEANLTSDLNLLPALKLTKDAELWDGIIGLRGIVRIHENWYIPYHADIGAGSSDLTWQAMAGLGYKARWGDTLLEYRHLEWDQGEDELLQNFNFSGPVIAFKFRF